MKRLLLSMCAVLSLAAMAQAQEPQQIKLPNFEALRKDIAKSNADIANPKKVDNSKTWVSRGELLISVYDKSTMGASAGMYHVAYSKLKAEERETKIGSTTYQTLVFPNIELHFQNQLVCWQETETVTEYPLSQALEAYRKAVELDAKQGYSKQIKLGLEKLALKMRAEGVNHYTLQDYKNAQKYFMESVQASTNPLVGRLDSVIAYYAGLMSLMESVSDFDNAITYLTICIDNSYFEDGDVFLRIAKAYELKGDKSAQEKSLIDGFMAFPKNQSILIELINMYLSAGDEATKVLPYLHQAQENEPQNGTLFFAEATLYEKLGNMNDAERLYIKAIEVNPNSYNAYYNLGALYYNRGVEYVKQSTAIKDWKDPKIKELEDQANVEFKRALEPFVKAHELQPKDKTALETVKNIYFRFRNESAEMMDKYNEYNEKFKQLPQAE